MPGTGDDEHTRRGPVRRPPVLSLLALSLLTAAECGGKLPLLSPPASCGDQCAAINCPAGGRCTLDQSCTAHCEPERMSPR